MLDERMLRQLAQAAFRQAEAYRALADVMHRVERLSAELPTARPILFRYRLAIRALTNSYRTSDELIRTATDMERQLLLLPENLHTLEQADDMELAWSQIVMDDQKARSR